MQGQGSDSLILAAIPRFCDSVTPGCAGSELLQGSALRLPLTEPRLCPERVPGAPGARRGRGRAGAAPARGSLEIAAEGSAPGAPCCQHHGWQEGLHRGLWQLVSAGHLGPLGEHGAVPVPPCSTPGSRCQPFSFLQGTRVICGARGSPVPTATASLCPRRGSAIAKIAGSNTARLGSFESQVNMWVLEEEVGGRRLTDIINTEHENVKYLPGHKLPPNVVSVGCQQPLRGAELTAGL